MPETELIRINPDLSIKLYEAVDDYDFTVRDLVEWILSDVDLEEYAKKLASKLESDEEAVEEETEQGTEEDSDEEDTDEEADDEAENFGKY